MTKGRKTAGDVYTPDYLVKNILDIAEYNGRHITRKHIIDNSAGDGQFMVEIVDRYCRVRAKECSNRQLHDELEKYIHAVEINQLALDECIQRCNKIIKKYSIKDVAWDFKCANTLSTNEYNNKMDYVVGNPPYVRIHNLGAQRELVRKLSSTHIGMTDLYIAFFEKGIDMLNDNGKLCYITPSSYFNSLAGTQLRKHIISNHMLRSICNLQHFQPFRATTYTAITLLDKKNVNRCLLYSTYDEANLRPSCNISLSYDEILIDDKYYFADEPTLLLLHNIIGCKYRSNILVKNGLATLADRIFIGSFPIDNAYVIPVIKASTGEQKAAIFPYDTNAHLVNEKQLRDYGGEIYKYLLNNKNKLNSRSIEKRLPWYAYGRSQAIADVFSNKLALNTLMRNIGDIKLNYAPPGVGIYSGLYVLSPLVPFSKIKECLLSNDFASYVRALGKYKSGGYYTFSSRDVQSYLNYKISDEEIVNE